MNKHEKILKEMVSEIGIFMILKTLERVCRNIGKDVAGKEMKDFHQKSWWEIQADAIQLAQIINKK